MPRQRDTRPDNPIALNLARIVFTLVTNPRGWRVRSLMKELGIQPRTYRKYKALLRDHFDFLFDRNGQSLVTEVREGDEAWLRLRDSPEPRGQDFPEIYSRVATMALARHVFGFLRGSAMADRMDEHFLDFCDRVGDRTFVFRDLFCGMDRKVFYLSPPPKDYGPHGRTIQVILRALCFNKRFSGTYQSARGESSKLLEPLTLILWNGGLYLVARTPQQKRPHLYVIDRFRKVRLGGGTFRYPALEEYSPDRFFDGHFGIFQEERDPVEVELIFAAKPWIRLFLTERTWHPTQRFQRLRDGRLRMTFRASCLVEVGRFVRSFGNDVVVVRPHAALLEAPDHHLDPAVEWQETA